jgi:hypothetical protein
MTTMYQSEFDELARALAALLAAWWRYRGRTDETNQPRDPVAQDHLGRLKETTTRARAPPQTSLRSEPRYIVRTLTNQVSE